METTSLLERKRKNKSQAGLDFGKFLLIELHSKETQSLFLNINL